jgi:hypothetical protein
MTDHLNYHLIAEALRYRPKHTQEWEYKSIAICSLIHYDFDISAFELIQTWDRDAETPRWIYTFWFYGVNGIQLVHRFEDDLWGTGNFPAIKCAEIVTEYFATGEPVVIYQYQPEED